MAPESIYSNLPLAQISRLASSLERLKDGFKLNLTGVEHLIFFSPSILCLIQSFLSSVSGNTIYLFFSQKSRTCPRVFTPLITYIQVWRVSCQFSKFCWLYLHKISWSFPLLSSPSTFLTARWLPTARSPFYGQFSQHPLVFPTEPCAGFDLLWLGFMFIHEPMTMAILGRKPILAARGGDSFPQTTQWLGVEGAVERVAVVGIVGVDSPLRKWGCYQKKPNGYWASGQEISTRVANQETTEWWKVKEFLFEIHWNIAFS